MQMTPELWSSVINALVKFGFDAALALLDGIKTSKTIDDAIAALQTAKTKTAQDYINEAKAAVPPV